VFCFLAKSHRRGEIVVFVEAEFEDPVVANRSCVGKVATLLSVNGDPVVFSFQMMLKRMYSKIAVGRADPPVLDELKVEFYKCEDKPSANLYAVNVVSRIAECKLSMVASVKRKGPQIEIPFCGTVDAQVQT
jgi:hypothetical protein